MKVLLTLIFISHIILVTALSAQQNYKQEFVNVTGNTEFVSSDSVINKSYITSNGEKFLRFELVLDTSLQAVWDAFVLDSEFTKWAVTHARIDLRVGGLVQTHYKKNAKIGDPGTISFMISNYLPMELITYKIFLNESFPEKCRNEDDNLQEIVQFYKLKDNTTKVVSSMIGWGKGEEWDDIYRKFEMGNKWTYMQLIKMFNK